MDSEKKALTEQKFKLPYHWIRDPLTRNSLVYFGYVKLVVEALRGSSKEVVDLGSGDGRLSAALVSGGHQVCGFEYFEHLVAYSRVLVREATFHPFDLTQEMTEEWGAHFGRYDVAVAIEVYEHLPPERCSTFLSTASRLLKPNGTLLLSVPSFLMPFSKLHYRHFAVGDIHREIADAGFVIKDTIGQYDIKKADRSLYFNPAIERLADNRLVRWKYFFSRRKDIFERTMNRVQHLDAAARYLVVAEKTPSSDPDSNSTVSGS